MLYSKEEVKDKLVRMKDRPHPDIKKGEKFIVLQVGSSDPFCVGDIVELTHNDNSNCPRFSGGGAFSYMYWRQVARYCPDTRRLASYKGEPEKDQSDKLSASEMVMLASVLEAASSMDSSVSITPRQIRFILDLMYGKIGKAFQ